MSRMTRYRLVIGAAGIALGLFGVYRLLTQVLNSQLVSIAEWIVGAVILHDAVLSPALVGVGYLVSFVPSRARRYVQGALIAGGLLTALGLVFVVYVRTDLLNHQLGGGSAALPRAGLPARRSKSILTQDYLSHLLVLLAIIAGAAVLLYVRRLVLDRGATHAAEPEPAIAGAAE